MNSKTIGVFDSGVGGLTVLKALTESLPTANYLYLGDTARLPYGTKSEDTINQYAHQAASFLMKQNIDLLVVACNTASAIALPHLQQQFPNIPIVGVVEPGAEAAHKATTSGHIAVIATEATVKAAGYQSALHRRNKDYLIEAIPCSLFVSLAEEGWIEGDIAEAVAKRYLDPLFSKPKKPDCLILGCTHFPTLKNTIQKVVGKDIKIVDSAVETAKAVASIIEMNPSETESNKTFFVTDAPQRFSRIAKSFLGGTISDSDIQLIDL